MEDEGRAITFGIGEILNCVVLKPENDMLAFSVNGDPED